MKFKQNKKKVDPRYFIEETSNRDKLQEQESVKAPPLKIDTSKTAPIKITDKPTTVAALQPAKGAPGPASVPAPGATAAGKLKPGDTAKINIPAPKDTPLETGTEATAGTKKLTIDEEQSVNFSDPAYLEEIITLAVTKLLSEKKKI